MKKLACLIALLAIIISSCSHGKLCCVMPKPVVITAQKNGEAWEAPVYISTRTPSNHILIATPGLAIMPTAKDSLSINLIYTGLGDYKPGDEQVSYTLFANGVKTAYVLDNTFDNKITISEFAVLHNEATMNPDPTEITATFNLRFTDPGHTTSVTFLGGKFTAFLAN